MPMTTAACAFCGMMLPTAAMEMTGHGWRCATCQLKSQIAAASGNANPMTEHLTRNEIEDVARGGRREALGGVGLVIAGIAGTVATMAAGGAIVVVFTGAIAGGLGMLAHGLHRRNQAKAALRDSPVARVVNH
jgi:hypothetical protein